MNISQKKIYSYFERDPQLRVLFIFNMPFVKEELSELEWTNGYRYIVFRGDWFTVKYRLENEWAKDKVILYFDQPSPVSSKADMAAFPLMDVLAANMEYHSQDHASFIQQYGLPESMTLFVERNIMQLQTEKMLRLLQPYFSDKSINTDIAERAFLSSYLGLKRVIEWDEVIIQMIILGRPAEEKKRLDFFSKLSKAPYIKRYLDEKLTGIFGISYDVNSPNKVEKIVQILKYNAIVQSLAPVEADNYKTNRITDSISLQHINRILELALSSPKTATPFKEALEELGADIRDENIILWYGTDANYYYVPDGLCIPIIKRLIQNDITDNPDKVLSRLEELMLKHNDNSELMDAMEYLLIVSHFYERSLAFGSFTLNSPSEYVSKYQSDFFLLDQLYRQATESYYKISPNSSLFETIQTVKRSFDVNYSKISNRLNLEWTNCVRETGGFGSIKMLRQQDFYDALVKPVQKKVAVIVSDALRYELADSLVAELGKTRHIAKLSSALAMLPTETKYCKPSLLPHKSLMLYGLKDEQNMSVDNKILDSTSKRSEHLASYRSDAICVTFEDIARYNQDKNREIFKHPVVYIFHDSIDSIGHETSAKNVVNGCAQEIMDIAAMVKKIHSTYNVTEVYVTADHGFLFNDMEFAEKDKLKVTDNTLERKSRYYLTDNATTCSDITKFRLSDVSGMDADNIYVGVPTGTNRLAAPSGGYMFAHGGASLQEMIIPVIISRQERTDSKEPVGVMLLNQKLTVTASRLRFTLLQTEPVGIDMKERIITVALYHNNEAVTPIKQIILDKSDSLLDARRHPVDLTLNKNVDSNILQLKVYDIEDNMNPIIKENVTNSTLIANDFDF